MGIGVRMCCPALGAKITGVDDHTYTSRGTPYSMVVLPKSNSSTPRCLQADDVSLGAQHRITHCTHIP